MKTDIKKAIYFSIILFAMVLSSCVDTEEDDADRIIGTWNWYESSGGIAGVVLTPETTGETRKVVFRKNGSVIFFKNDKIILFSTYTLGVEETIISEEPLSVVEVDGRDMVYILSFPYEGELELQENVYDGFTHRYKKL